MSRRVIVLVISILTALGFAAAAFFYDRYSASEKTPPAAPAASSLVRFHSPVIGAATAPVTIVEFFDPSCEACRAFFPLVKQILADNPNDVRLVLRYVLFHEGSETAARILETARKQGVFEPVLEALMVAQPQWHSDPQVLKAWEAAEAAGLDVEKARAEMMAADITEALKRDSQDAQSAGVRQTPTFFVNGKPLLSFGAQPLIDLVNAEVAQSK
jgi:protein-disulfide isomerase